MLQLYTNLMSFSSPCKIKSGLNDLDKIFNNYAWVVESNTLRLVLLTNSLKHEVTNSNSVDFIKYDIACHYQSIFGEWERSKF